MTISKELFFRVLAYCSHSISILFFNIKVNGIEQKMEKSIAQKIGIISQFLFTNFSLSFFQKTHAIRNKKKLEN